MTMTSPYTDIPTTNSNSSDNHYRSPIRSLQRGRPSRRLFKRRWLKKLRPKRLLRTCAVLFVLAVFVYVSKTNQVLGPSGPGARLQSVATSGITGVLENVKQAMSPDSDPAPSTSTRSATPSPTSELASISSGNPPEQGPHPEKRILDTQTIYVVPEGSSLWRTGIRFINDEALLDKLIDNLAERGMKVRNVNEGVYFTVTDLGGEGLVVTIEADGNTYESRVFEDDVVTNSLSASNS